VCSALTHNERGVDEDHMRNRGVSGSGGDLRDEVNGSSGRHDVVKLLGVFLSVP
jgi:hypothetical protein